MAYTSAYIYISRDTVVSPDTFLYLTRFYKKKKKKSKCETSWKQYSVESNLLIL